MAQMTIKECKDAAYQLLNHYSIAGDIVPLTYNDQQDDDNRMLNLINDAQMYIATSIKPISTFETVVVPVLDKSVPYAEIEVNMPEDFDEIIAIYFFPALDANGRPVEGGGGKDCCCTQQFMKNWRSYRWLGDKILYLPNRPAGTYKIEYARYPVRYTAETPETTELDNTPDTHPPIPYYVAAMIAVEENPKLYYALYNVWETRLARLVERKKPYANVNQICDVYGFNHYWGVD